MRKNSRNPRPARIIIRFTGLSRHAASHRIIKGAGEHEAAANAFTDTILEALTEGEKVQLIGFGTFEVKERAARVGHKPGTGETIEIAAKKTPVFRAGKGFKDEF